MWRSILVATLTTAISACAPHQDTMRRSIEPRVSAPDCAAEGRQFDEASRQCVAIRPIHRAALIKPRTGADQSASAPNHGMPIEPHATIDQSLQGETKLMSGMVALLRSHGYQCEAISSAKPFSTSDGFRLTCDHARHRYRIEANKGSWDIRAE